MLQAPSYLSISQLNLLYRLIETIHIRKNTAF